MFYVVFPTIIIIIIISIIIIIIIIIIMNIAIDIRYIVLLFHRPFYFKIRVK